MGRTCEFDERCDFFTDQYGRVRAARGITAGEWAPMCWVHRTQLPPTMLWTERELLTGIDEVTGQELREVI